MAQQNVPEAASASVTQSLDRAIEILRLVGDHNEEGVKLVELSRAAGLAKPTAHRLVRALIRHGLVERCARSDTYHLGKDIFVLGILASARHGIARIAASHLRHLADETGDVVLLTVRQGRHGVCIQREEGSFPIRSHALRVGDRHPLGVGSNTLAILAALDDAEFEPIAEATMREVAEKYPTFADLNLRLEVQRTRQEGYALNPGRLVAGSWGIAVPVRDARGVCVGALSIAAIERRMDPGRQTELAGLLNREAVALSQALGATAR